MHGHLPRRHAQSHHAPLSKHYSSSPSPVGDPLGMHARRRRLSGSVTPIHLCPETNAGPDRRARRPSLPKNKIQPHGCRPSKFRARGISLVPEEEIPVIIPSHGRRRSQLYQPHRPPHLPIPVSVPRATFCDLTDLPTGTPPQVSHWRHPPRRARRPPPIYPPVRLPQLPTLVRRPRPLPVYPLKLPRPPSDACPSGRFGRRGPRTFSANPIAEPRIQPPRCAPTRYQRSPSDQAILEQHLHALKQISSPKEQGEEFVDQVLGFVTTFAGSNDEVYQLAKQDLLGAMECREVNYPRLEEAFLDVPKECFGGFESSVDRVAELGQVMQVYREKITKDKKVIKMLVGMVNMMEQYL